MTAVLIVAISLAAMVLFRTARYLAIVAFLIALGFFVMRFEAWKATQPPIHTVSD